MIPYILHVSILLAGCYIFYWLLLRQETFFQLNRSVLIGCLVIPLILPLLTIPASWSLGFFENGKTSSTYRNSTTYISAKDAGEISILEKSKNTMEPSNEESSIPTEESGNSENLVVGSNASMSIGEVMTYLYFTGVIIFSLAFFVQLIMILAKASSLQSFKDGKYKIVELVKDEAPYSFWNIIFINPTKYDPDTYEQILAHEKIHIDQTHFLDKLLVEVILIAFWFNPFVWLFRKAITNNLEFLTDQSMLTKGFAKQNYQLSLLKVSVPQHPLNLTINYNQSFLKNRIAMMNMKKSSARSIWKYLFILPLLGFSILSLNAVNDTPSELVTNDETISNEIKPTEEPIIEKSNIPEIEEENNTVSEIPATIPSTNHEVSSAPSTKEEILKDQLKKELISNLKQDGLWKKGDHVFKLFQNKIVYDGKELNQRLNKKYKAIFDKYGILPNTNRLLILSPIVVMSGSFISDNVKSDNGTHVDIFDDHEDLDVNGNKTGGNSQSGTHAHIEGESISHSNSKNHHHSHSVSEGTIVKTINGVTSIRGKAGSIHEVNGRTITIPEDGENKTYIIEDNDRFYALIPEGTYSRSPKDRTYSLFENEPNWTNNPNTYIGNMSSTSYWRLPDFYKKVRKELIKDDIIEVGEKIKMYFEEDYVDVNGWKLTGGHDLKYINLAKQYNIPALEGSRIEIYKDNIILISKIVDLQQLRLDILNSLLEDGLISDLKEEVKLKIPGNRIILNGRDIPKNRFDYYRKLIHQNQICPAPGKEIDINIKKKGGLFKKNNTIAIRVGYAQDGSYLGSIMTN